jgi:hypothetical protein
MKRQLVKSWREVPLVEVIWQDACINTDHEGQLNDQEATKQFGGLALCSDIGYLISKTKTEIRLAVSLCRDDNSYRHSNTIPRGWIKSLNFFHRSDDQPPDPRSDNQLPSPGDGTK